ncbi:hypothetical protein [Mycobacterium gordonae]|uniref:Uncharacterized protein n=1 Tax=Mycobacterium gordonae TaxID=1778 RepID=A0A1X1X969_MYCGO|nr:hypothetical protein [Mycobacterium gordonae]MCV7005652.1 hypothetical protein [Mycobacterium gordonae]ODR23510.1 hypothetical protein BHQ23_04615 [Mycobacterium gordonae]ORV95218.1 hypothetical protein AWC08_15315 [Mycobacterium gordonae]
MTPLEPDKRHGSIRWPNHEYIDGTALYHAALKQAEATLADDEEILRLDIGDELDRERSTERMLMYNYTYMVSRI